MERAQFLIKQYGWVLTLLALTLVAQMLGRGCGLLAAGALPPPPVRLATGPLAAIPPDQRSRVQPRGYYDIITGRNLFNSNPPPEGSSAPASVIPVADLKDKAKVRGTIVGSSSSMALIEILAKHETTLFLVGDLITEGAEVVEILPEGVRYKQGERVGFLSLEDENAKTAAAPPPSGPLAAFSAPPDPEGGAPPSDPNIKQVSDTEFVIDQRELENQLANINQLILQARVVPNFTAGKIDGFKIFAIKPDSIFRKLGMRNGDVIMAVNGNNLDNPQKGLQVFQDLQGQRNFSINIRRRSENLMYQYDVR